MRKGSVLVVCYESSLKFGLVDGLPLMKFMPIHEPTATNEIHAFWFGGFRATGIHEKWNHPFDLAPPMKSIHKRRTDENIWTKSSFKKTGAAIESIHEQRTYDLAPPIKTNHDLWFSGTSKSYRHKDDLWFGKSPLVKKVWTRTKDMHEYYEWTWAKNMT